MTATVSGHAEEGFGAIADEFRRNFHERKEVGAACAVVVDGKPVVDLWGGHQDKKRTRPWTEHTLVTVFSTSKGMAATAMAVAHARGLFELDSPVASYWPEFAQSGKESITVRQLLAHEAGLAVLDARPDVATIADHVVLGRLLAAQTPKWLPGTTHGYHAVTLGWYESELLQRVDPQARRIGRFFADEVADALGVEFYLGLPDTVEPDRVATVLGAGMARQALHAHELPWPLFRRMMNPRSLTVKAMTTARIGKNLSDLNNRRLLEIELPSFNGTGTARAIATVYGELAIGGARLGLTAATIDELHREVPASFDQVFGLDSAFAMGFMKAFPILPFGSSPKAFGHTGAGGSFGFADPDTAVGYAYAMNRAGYSLPTDPREIALRDALARCTT